MRKIIVMVLFMAFLLQNALAQTKSIRGNVTDEQNEPIPSVTVLIKGTTTGVITNVNGDYNITASVGDILIFKFLGMESQEIRVDKQNVINVVMSTSNVALNEVVAIGYGSVKRKDLTGATASVSARDLSEDRAVVSLQEALKGKVSGVRIIQNSGGPGAQSTVLIRGATSFSGDNQPLYVVDGFPVENFDLNSDDIETIDVLKDAASTSIYGSRGANGVIIVTTKKGKKGEPRIEVSAKYGASNLANKVGVLDNVQWIKQMYDQLLGYGYLRKGTWDGVKHPQFDYYQDVEGNIWVLPGLDPFGNPIAAKNHELYRDSTNTDWQDATFRTAVFQDYRINFSSGTDRSSYNLSLNIIDEEGLVPNNKVQKLLGRFNMMQKLTDRLEINSNTYFTKVKDEGYRDVAHFVLTRSPSEPLEEVWNPSVTVPGYVKTDLITKPIAQTEAIVNETYSSVFQSNLTFNYKISKKLTFVVGGSYRNVSEDKENYIPSNIPGIGSNYNGVAQYWRNAYQYMTNENYLTFTDKIGDHNITAMLGNSVEWYEHKAFVSENRSFELENLEFYGIAGGTEPQIPSAGYTETSLASFYGRLNYSYKDKYLLKATMRADGSSKFAANNKWGYFPSVGIAWRLSEEQFAKSISWFPTTKIRATWGIAGKQGIQPYQSLSVIEAGTTTIDGINRTLAAYPLRLANPDLKWEKNEEFDIGIDLYFAKGRYNFTADVFRKNTDGLLLDLPVPAYTGYSSRTSNFGRLQNEGLELQLNATPIQQDFKWESTINFTFGRSKVLEVGEQDELYIPYGILKEGEPIGVWYGYEQDGIWQSQTEIDEAIANGFTGQLGASASAVKPGYTRFVDQLTIDTDGDGIPDLADGAIDSNDRVGLGKSTPDFTGGFFNTFSWKGFSLNVGLQFSYGAKIFNSNRIAMEEGRGGANQTIMAANRWLPDLYSVDPDNPEEFELLRPGNSSDEIRIGAGNAEGDLIDRYIEDGSYIRLSDVSVGYDLPKNFLNKLKLTNCRVYVTGQNLKLWTEYTGYDPEVNNGEYRSILPGQDAGAYPREKTIALGIKMTL